MTLYTFQMLYIELSKYEYELWLIAQGIVQQCVDETESSGLAIKLKKAMCGLLISDLLHYSYCYMVLR